MATVDKVGVGEDLIRHRFRQALPSTIIPVIAVARNLTLNELGTLASEHLPFIKTDIIQNTTSECYKRQT